MHPHIWQLLHEPNDTFGGIQQLQMIILPSELGCITMPKEKQEDIAFGIALKPIPFEFVTDAKLQPIPSLEPDGLLVYCNPFARDLVLPCAVVWLVKEVLHLLHWILLLLLCQI
jgi:hypothetical protein